MSDRLRDDTGLVSTVAVATVGLTLLLLVAAGHLLLMSYVAGVAQAAVEEGARQGAAVGSASACRARAEAALADGIGGLLLRGVGPVECAVTAGEVRARVELAVASWLPGLPALHRTRQATVAVPEDR